MSGTQKLEKYEPPSLSIATPVEEIPLTTLAAARPSTPPPSTRATDREPAVEKLRTRLARKFTTLADEVTASFADFQIGAGAWRPELMAPEGMSTGGGKRASQHLRLRPMREGHRVLVGGLVDPMTNTAELRDYEYMVALQYARFGAGSALGITYAEWEQFLRRTELLLAGEDITTTRVGPPAELRLVASRAGGISSRTLALIALGIVIPLALVVLWRVVVVLMR